MKSIIFLLSVCLVGIQSLHAQAIGVDKTKVEINNVSKDLKLYPNPVEDVLHLKSSSKIDLVSLCDKHGQLVEQFIPIDNKINLAKIQPGFYLLCVFVEGKPVKKRMLKKM